MKSDGVVHNCEELMDFLEVTDFCDSERFRDLKRSGPCVEVMC